MNKTINNINIILNQFGWPINLSYQTRSISNITYELVNFHKNNINTLANYNISELLSLYLLIDYAIKDLWEEEFNIVTWLDLYEDGYKLLNKIKKLIK